MAARLLHDVRAAAILWDVVFGRITVFAAAEDVATVITVITVITYYYCFYHLVMPPKRAIARGFR